MVCANKVEAADCAVLFTSVRLIVGVALLVVLGKIVLQATNPTVVVITDNILVSHFDSAVPGITSTSRNKSIHPSSTNHPLFLSAASH
jgi:hypothetical protein